MPVRDCASTPRLPSLNGLFSKSASLKVAQSDINAGYFIIDMILLMRF